MTALAPRIDTLEKASNNQWVTSKSYLVDDIVQKDDFLIRCLTNHTSGTFATDVASGYWQLATPATNLLINSNFDIWQRGTSFSASGYSADRWRNQSANTTVTRTAFTAGQTAVPNNPTYYAKFVRSIAAGVANEICSQRIEFPHKLSGKTISVSFWAMATSTKQFEVDFLGVMNGSTVLDTTNVVFTATTSWQKFSFTFTLSNFASGATITANDYIAVRIIENAGLSTFTLNIAQVMINEGPAPANFQTAGANFQAELGMCQRYYTKSFPIETVPSNSHSVWEPYLLLGAVVNSQMSTVVTKFPVTMRITPSIILWGGEGIGAVNGGSIYVNGVARTASIDRIDTTRICRLTNTSGVTWNAGDIVIFNYTANAEL